SIFNSPFASFVVSSLFSVSCLSPSFSLSSSLLHAAKTRIKLKNNNRNKDFLLNIFILLFSLMNDYTFLCNRFQVSYQKMMKNLHSGTIKKLVILFRENNQFFLCY